METKTLFEKQLKRREVFSGDAVNFRADSIRLPDGKTATREFMDHPGAVAILPVLAGKTRPDEDEFIKVERMFLCWILTSEFCILYSVF